MEIVELNRFVAIANAQTLQSAAVKLHTTPGALSKSLKKLESSLGVLLFDRIGKQLVLNENGMRLLPEAIKILDLTQNIKSLLAPQQPMFCCRISAPAILQYRWVALIGQQASGIQMSYETDFEVAALDKLKRAQVDVALTTSLVKPYLTDDLEVNSLGQLRLELAVGATHPLAHKVDVTHEDLASFPFAVPEVSPFCGEVRGIGCDGWPTTHFHREVKWVLNDYAALCELVRCGKAIAYLPDYMISAWQLEKLPVVDDASNNAEQLCLIHRRSAPVWIKELVKTLTG
ncbi:LysR family transcriptional regulator [Pseudoalteromonas sp. DL2-H2.2]|uniref:LysR family transcriptional regulator n=1 Tax=Pseudoalteromonas sp. DL2-H2.2 TaxID=2908889 RepID=UPI001F3D9402|nr:LysR family transcriptional regulator [Pseudoalteromonas sp. DL2-H2.2]MCF2909409.1 LysR family transcriptional regulator [Pseudoalteromonas sp. DL2-H2.2]